MIRKTFPPQRHQLIIHIEKDSLMHGAAHQCSIEHGPFLSPASARRLACDTELLTVLEDGQGNVLNVGRKTRTVSPAMRRALTCRDHGCRFPEALYPQFAVHQAHEESLAIERQHQHMGLHIDQLTAITRWQGERMDYSMALDALMGSGAMLGSAA